MPNKVFIRDIPKGRYPELNPGDTLLYRAAPDQMDKTDTHLMILSPAPANAADNINFLLTVGHWEPDRMHNTDLGIWFLSHILLTRQQLRSLTQICGGRN